MVFHKPEYWTLIVATSTFGVLCSLAPQDAPRSLGVVAPRLFSIAYPEESAENEDTTIGHGSQAETAMMNFVRERHNRNHLDGPSSSIDVFYDFVEGKAMIDAWFARLTNEDIYEFEQSFAVRYSLVVVTACADDGICRGLWWKSLMQILVESRKPFGNEPITILVH